MEYCYYCLYFQYERQRWTKESGRAAWLGEDIMEGKQVMCVYVRMCVCVCVRMHVRMYDYQVTDRIYTT
jgi:hypothetical protein